ncbi:MAG: MATE family efflux transporter [Clostridia bacterium]|nr:MATE family efflux transporter [Clostridia bacterium]
MWKNIINQAVPLTLAQLVHLLYNVVDRIYLGHMPGADSLALTGIGLSFPLITLIGAFTALFGTGGTPLFSIARGEKDENRAEHILGNCTALLLISSVVLFVFCYALRRPILYLFGASDASYVYADQYLRIYLFGTLFTMLTTGLNGFINAQGFPRTGMLTTLLGAVLNIILDPLFIFVFHMGVGGAALATVLSQLASCLWVMHFLTGKKALLVIRPQHLRLRWDTVKNIISLGCAGFIMNGTSCLVQIVCNTTLQRWGGDLYVGIMTVIGSLRDILMLPVNGISQGAQPVIGYNYGAKRNDRVKEGIRFTTYLGTAFTLVAWIAIMVFPRQMFSIFTKDTTLLSEGARVMNLYFFGFVFMSFQFAGQITFTALGYAKRAILFSLLRKAIIVAPLTVLLPIWGFGVDGVFLAEPISNAVGGLACGITMYLTVYRKLE